MSQQRRLKILGTRGVPARHGGFETFAERLALYLVDQGWEVTVYCQESGRGAIHEDDWCGVGRIRIPVASEGAAGTVQFDFRATHHASRRPGLNLVLGYNTAVFGVMLRGQVQLINMDGIEWRRAKWNALERAWLYCNERCAALLGTHLIADHPLIERHLADSWPPKPIAMIPYGADWIEDAPVAPVRSLGLEPGRYALVVARPEVENSLLEIISAFSRSKRGVDLAVLGNYDPDHNRYHERVVGAASPEVRFLGALYDKRVVAALRFHARLYIHGHTVGGTNPSLVEAMGAGSAVLAHDNGFNHWVAGDAALFFADAQECDRALDRVLDGDSLLRRMREASRRRFADRFRWSDVLAQYEDLLLTYLRPHATTGATGASDEMRLEEG